MHILFAVGRVLLVLIFIVSGTQKLLDISGTAAVMAPVVTVPDALAGIVNQLQDATGMKLPQLLAIFVGVIEVVCGLLIAFNIATRGAALVLVIFALAATFYFHDFWNMAGDARQNNMVHALKNLSMIGGLLIFMVLGSWRPLAANDRV
jgi:uncharacterized membrane protein YphA (DoxX/SURF4 family)